MDLRAPGEWLELLDPTLRRGLVVRLQRAVNWFAANRLRRPFDFTINHDQVETAAPPGAAISNQSARKRGNLVLWQLLGAHE